MNDFVFEIFVPNGTPTYTYVKRVEKKNEEHLATALEIPKLVISISGPSKTGKTALVDTLITTDRLVPITGQSLHSSNDLWQSVMRWIGGPDEVEKIKERALKGSFAGKASAEAGVLVAKAKTEGELSGSAEFTTATSKKFGTVFFEAVAKELGGSDFVVFLDDFHYIEEDAQVEIAKSIKAIAERNVRVCIASVPHKSDDMVRANDELSGRIFSIGFDYWSVQELEVIANSGFEHLCVNIAPHIIKRLATEALGSPQLMQSLCLNLCLEKGIRDKQGPNNKTDISDNEYRSVLERTTLQTDYSRTVEKLHTGAKERGTQRKEFDLTDGSNGDVYRAILLALVQNPPMLSFDYDQIMDRIKSICVKESPVGSSVQLALKQMDGIAKDIKRDSPVLEWDDDKLEVTNPYFMFYLRSSQKINQIHEGKSGMV
ncbi:ATP-binding protein [Nitratireductor aquibiodomus]|uniref:ATP-binding protein n=1 Tax=Nitratireductor aquibiodomus TaxID=204799 RepID=UPI0019D40188|nr:ATP-binding protein [Nitratireductor aquibiodomus]MBN7764072.1 ATP-binding protein [Nitratireductor aquibiodomus]